MKKFFAFAIAAATMAVGCQKFQDLINPNNNQTVGEDELVEIKFSSNVVTVETKITDLKDAGTVYLYGLNDAAEGTANRRELKNVAATVGGDAEPYELTLAEPAFYHSSANYDFFGYYLDGATVTGDLATGYESALPIVITGAEDVLLGAGKENGAYNAVAARGGKNVEIEFLHKLSKFTFSAVNMGNSELTLNDIVVVTPLSGEINVTGGQTLVATGEPANIDLEVTPFTLTGRQGVEPAPEDYTPADVEALVFPNSTYTLHFNLTQGTDSRWIPVTFSEAIEEGKAYNFEVKLYSLEEIQITATLKAWDAVTIGIDTAGTEEGNSPLA